MKSFTLKEKYLILTSNIRLYLASRAVVFQLLGLIVIIKIPVVARI